MTALWVATTRPLHTENSGEMTAWYSTETLLFLIGRENGSKHTELHYLAINVPKLYLATQTWVWMFSVTTIHIIPGGRRVKSLTSHRSPHLPRTITHCLWHEGTSSIASLPWMGYFVGLLSAVSLVSIYTHLGGGLQSTLDQGKSVAAEAKSGINDLQILHPSH